MEEFARMIYEQWAKAQMDRDLYFDKGSDLMNRLEKILSRDLSDEIYETFCDFKIQLFHNRRFHLL